MSVIKEKQKYWNQQKKQGATVFEEIRKNVMQTEFNKVSETQNFKYKTETICLMNNGGRQYLTNILDVFTIGIHQIARDPVINNISIKGLLPADVEKLDKLIEKNGYIWIQDLINLFEEFYEILFFHKSRFLGDKQINAILILNVDSVAIKRRNMINDKIKSSILNNLMK